MGDFANKDADLHKHAGNLRERISTNPADSSVLAAFWATLGWDMFETSKYAIVYSAKDLIENETAPCYWSKTITLVAKESLPEMEK